MKPNGFFSFVNSMLLVFSFFALTSFGQETENKKPSENTAVGKKISQNQNSSEKTENIARGDESAQRYRIGFQDSVQINIFRHPELSGTYSINPSGTIFLPRLDAPVVAVCKTERELADDIAAAYKKDYLKNPFVDVRAVEQKSQAFGVIGAVQKPGYYYVSRKVHLLELLSFAGGPTELAGTQLIVARTGGSSSCTEKNAAAKTDENPEIELLDFKIKDVQAARQYLWMKPGDIVSVLEADPFYVTGNVNKPGMFLLKTPTTLTQAIARAEGYKPASKKDNIRILRAKPGSNEREELVYKLKDIENKKIEDPLLQANDIVAVSEDKIKSIIFGVTTSITNGVGNLPPFIIK